MDANEERTAVVLSGGGERVIAWQIGVLAGLADAGVDLRRAARVVGTSAGSQVAARLSAGEDMRVAGDLLALTEVRPVTPHEDAPFEALARYYADAGGEAEGRRRIGALALGAGVERIDPLIAGQAAWERPDSWPAALRLATIDAERGHRVVLDSDSGATVAVGVAASRAVPVIKRPVRLRRRWLVDGAIGSATNADAAVDGDGAVERVIIVAALPDDGHHPTLARLWDDALRRELAELDAEGVEICIIRATTADLTAMGPDPLSDGRAAPAVTAGREAGRVVAPALQTPSEVSTPIAA